jgi:chemotaxis protein CheZ
MSTVMTRPLNDVLEDNLKALFIYIQRVRKEIASLNSAGDGENKFVTMGEQLDGIVESTMDATEIIMGAVEANANTVHELRGQITDEKQRVLLDQLLENQNAVFEACAFQDLTGQRISKIIKSVTYVEERVNALREI